MTADWKVSVRRICSVFQFSRSTHQYKSVRGDQAELKKRIKEIAETRVGYGYLRIHVLLNREGWNVNHKRVYRLYKELNLQHPNGVSALVSVMIAKWRQRQIRFGRWISSTTS